MIQLNLTRALVVLSVGIALSACSSNETNPPNSTSINSDQSVKAFARYVPERQDDFAWENNKVAFRVYGPAAPLAGHSSGVDAWLKRVDYPIINKWYKANTEGVSYHVDHGEGYDPYHTGISRGVGGSAIWVEGKPYAAHNYKSYKILKNNGNKVVFELVYEWYTPLGIVKELKTISLPLGTQLYSVNSTFTLDGKPAALPIAIGIATHDEQAKVNFSKETGRISAWESFDNKGLGTGAIIDPSKVEDIKHLVSEVKDESHIWLFTSTSPEGKLSYKAGFAWQAAGDITTNKQWMSYLDNYKL